MAGMLGPYRALDLTDEKGFLCGKILADLGAEVIKVEKPGGDPSRLIEPFFQDQKHPERSLFYWAYNQGKKGITLMLETLEGRELFLRLVATADWVIESFHPGYLESIDLGYKTLSQTNRGIILTSIAPFGQTGPYKDYKAPDIVVQAMGGVLFVCGEPDMPPVRLPAPQSYLNGSAAAAVGSLMALYHRNLTGEGQQVDVSMQASLIPALFNIPSWWEFEEVVVKRAGTFRTGLSSATRQAQTWQCKDGYVTFIIIGGHRGASTNRALVEWMDSDGMADDFLKSINWDEFDFAAARPDFHRQVEERVRRFFTVHTVSELYQGALEREIMLYPVSTIPDIAQDPQLEARGFWTNVEHPELSTSFTYPGAFVKGSNNPCACGRRAPLVGEDNEEIYVRQLQLSEEEIVALRRRGVI